jgi:lipoprotein-anchoring transpeptidase ErfK/SrfK
MSHSPGPARPLLGIRRGVAVAGLGIAAACALSAPAVATPGTASSQETVALLRDHVVRAAPNARAHRVEAVAGRRPLTGARTVLPVLGRAGRNQAWLRVRLPGRPNGHSGWISANRTRTGSTEWRIEVKLSTRRVTVYRAGRIVRRFRAGVGRPSTPTPRGRFFVEEALAISAAESGAPFALATSARSNVFQEFEGGPGQIALHGTAHLSGGLGAAVSHGCIRLSTRAITWLSRRIGAGVPLAIVR